MGVLFQVFWQKKDHVIISMEPHSNNTLYHIADKETNMPKELMAKHKTGNSIANTQDLPQSCTC